MISLGAATGSEDNRITRLPPHRFDHLLALGVDPWRGPLLNLLKLLLLEYMIQVLLIRLVRSLIIE